MIRAFLIAFVSGLLLIAIMHNAYQTEQSFKRCDQLIQEIHQHAEQLKNM